MGLEHMGRFAGMEGHRHLRRSMQAGRPLRITGQAGRQVDGDNRSGRMPDRFDQFCSLPFQRPVEPGSEERIHDQCAFLQGWQSCRFDRPGPLPCRPGRIAPQGLRPTEQTNPHWPASLGQLSGNDETIATIIAGPAQDLDRAHRPALSNRIGHSPPGIRHKLLRGQTLFHGETVARGAVLGVQHRIRHGRSIVWQACLQLRHFAEPLFQSSVSILSRFGPALASRRDHWSR